MNDIVSLGHPALAITGSAASAWHYDSQNLSGRVHNNAACKCIVRTQITQNADVMHHQ